MPPLRRVLPAHDDDVEGVDHRRSENRQTAEQCGRPHVRLGLADEDDDDADEGGDRSASRASADRLLEDEGGKDERDQWRNKGQRHGLRHWHPR